MALIVGGTTVTGTQTLDATKLTGNLPAISGASLTGIVAIEVGTILPWSNSTLPSGYLNCDGSAVSRSTYSALFAIISTDYGAGDGSSTFNLPDLQDRVPLGVSGSKAVASTGGAETVSSSGSVTIAELTPAGNVGGSTGNTTISVSTMPSHQHNMYTRDGNNSGNPSSTGYTQYYINAGDGKQDLQTVATGGGGAHSHNMSANFSGTAVTPTGNFSGSATSVIQPYVAVKFMIKT
tara:strand:- start:1251 stop:1958 length:708 start_codon:yes stop_codon:yes gene_type:complete